MILYLFPALAALLLISLGFIYYLKQKNIALNFTLIQAQERQALLEQYHANEIEILKKNETELLHQFKSLSSDALQQNNAQFMNLAKTVFEKFNAEAKSDLDKKETAIHDMLKPVNASLDKVSKHINEIELKREGAYAGLKQHISGLVEAQEHLRREAQQLSKALKSPTSRGKWGEIQLKRVVELAGMLEHCDFTEQTHIQTENGAIRPDMIVNLPNKKNIIIDAKTPLDAYLRAFETDGISEFDKKSLLDQHAKHIRMHIKTLSSKQYWNQFESSPEFIVMFLPGESFFSAALEVDPELTEFGISSSIILATPTTLIALLRAVAYGWRQESLAQNAQEISKLGNELYKRLHDMTKHFNGVGQNLNRAVQSFNKTLGSYDHRVLSSARKLKDLSIGGDIEIESPDTIELLSKEQH